MKASGSVQKATGNTEQSLYVVLLLFAVFGAILFLNKKKQARKKGKQQQHYQSKKPASEAPATPPPLAASSPPAQKTTQPPTKLIKRQKNVVEKAHTPPPVTKDLAAIKQQSEEDRQRAKAAKEKRDAEKERKTREKKERDEKEKKEKDRREKEKKEELARKKCEERDRKDAEKQIKKEQELAKLAKLAKKKQLDTLNASLTAAVSGSILIMSASRPHVKPVSLVRQPTTKIEVVPPVIPVKVNVKNVKKTVVPVPPQKQSVKNVAPLSTANPLWKQASVPPQVVTGSPASSSMASPQGKQDSPSTSPPAPNTQQQRPPVVPLPLPVTGQPAMQWQHSPADPLPMCPLDRLCDCINDPFHHSQFRHTCKIQGCELSQQPWHTRLFVHDESNSGTGEAGNIIVYNTENFSYVALQGNWAKVKIAKVKEKIAIHLSIPHEQQMLTTKAGDLLNDPAKSCKDAGIENGCTLFVTRIPAGQDQASFLQMNVNARPFYPYPPQAQQPPVLPHLPQPQQQHQHVMGPRSFVAPAPVQPVVATPISVPAIVPGMVPVPPQQQQQQQQPLKSVDKVPAPKGTAVQDTNGIIWSDVVPNESGYEDQLFHIGY
eukprot:TRINITY_DN5600_c0_g3_i1.p1 TRINITY_DN5600_c0_g3~~TRINITY_DN5600_c0_g3_i1.p1  ORF type:complete len:603 (+),score=119.05 TRINITY_DN5600_c0_g3_i1:94-1902(+)